MSCRSALAPLLPWPGAASPSPPPTSEAEVRTGRLAWRCAPTQRPALPHLPRSEQSCITIDHAPSCPHRDRCRSTTIGSDAVAAGEPAFLDSPPDTAITRYSGCGASSPHRLLAR
jgi:hypothetical protein